MSWQEAIATIGSEAEHSSPGDMKAIGESLVALLEFISKKAIASEARLGGNIVRAARYESLAEMAYEALPAECRW